MINKQKFDFIKEKHGLHASWAVWVNEGDTPKSNMGDLSIFEQAPKVGEIGAGFQMSANGTRVLSYLGLTAAMKSIAWQPEGKEIRIWNSGQTWKLFDLGAESVERYGFPYLMFHRADLHRLLVAAVQAEKPDAIHLDSFCISCDQNEHEVILHIANKEDVVGNALIGADGTHSKIRQSLYGEENKEFSGRFGR